MKEKHLELREDIYVFGVRKYIHTIENNIHEDKNLPLLKFDKTVNIKGKENLV